MLLPAQNGGRVMSMEIMIPNKAIRNLIGEDKMHQIYSIMQTGQDTSGMQTMNQALLTLAERRFISMDLARASTSEPEELEDLINKRLTSPKKTVTPTKRGA